MRGAQAAPVPGMPVERLATGLPGPAAPPAAVNLGAAQRMSLANYLAGDGFRSSRADVSWLGILVDFEDRRFPGSYEEALNPLHLPELPDGVVTTELRPWFEAVMARTSEYYATVSDSFVLLQPTLADTLLSLGSSMNVYGDDTLSWEEGVRLLMAEVVDSLDAVIDFSAWDLVTVIHAGPGQESDLLRDSPEQIWSGYMDFESLSEAFADSVPDPPVADWPGIPTDDAGYVLRHFSIAPELEVEEDMTPHFVLGTLGVYAHQLGSYLGLLSLGDYFDPRAQGAGNFDLMSSGLWNALGFVPGPPCAFNRLLLGWDSPLVIAAADCEDGDPAGGLFLRARSWEQPGDSTLLKLPISDREYFLVENRNQDADGDGAFSFDDANGNHIPDNSESLLGAEFDYYTTQYNSDDTTPGSGLFIWRIDEALLHLTFDFDTNLINAYNDHYGVMLLEADGYPDLSTVSYDENAYGGDFDAFRATGGANGLVATATAADASSLPSTRSAEGADSGWRFHSVGPHGPVMDFTARWERTGFPRADEILGNRLPLGDPVLADFIADVDDLPDFAFLCGDGGDSLFVFVAPGGSFADADQVAAVTGTPAGSLAAGDLDADGLAEIVLLTADGRLYAWRGDGTPAWGGDPQEPLAEVEAASVTPMIHNVQGEFGPPTLPPDFDAGDKVLVMEELPDTGLGYSRCRPRWFRGDGSEHTGFDAALAPLWAEALRGLPAGPPALGLEVPLAQRGYGHPAPELSFFNFCLVDSSTASARILRLPALSGGEGAQQTARELAFIPGSDSKVQMASADLDADGLDDLIVEAEGQLLIWFPAGRFGGGGAGETLFRGDAHGSSQAQTLLPADLEGKGTLAALSATATSLAAYGPEGTPLADWQLGIPQNDPAPDLWRDPSQWLLARRDGDGRDTPLLLTLDGRLFAGRQALALDRPDQFIGGDLGGSPALADIDGDGLLELRGLSGFKPVAGNTAVEDTLLAGALTRHWQLETDWPAHAQGWHQGGADAGRTRRVAAAGAYEPAATGTSAFAAAYAYPNPAGDSVTWRVETDSPDRFTLSLYDLEGQRRLRLTGATDGFSPWEGESRLEGLASGVYFYVIESESSGRLETGRLAILR